MSATAQAPELSRAQAQEESRRTIRLGASLTLTYAVMNMLATIIACYALHVRRVGVEEMTRHGTVF